MPELADTLVATEADRLEQAEALVRGFCGWHIAPSRTETNAVLRGSGQQVLLLPSLHVTAVTSITDDTTPLVVEDDYIWSEAGVLTRSGLWGTASVTVTYTHGYISPPADVVAVVQAVAQRAVDNPGSIGREQAGPYSRQFATAANGESPTLALLESEKDILRRYRIPAVA